MLYFLTDNYLMSELHVHVQAVHVPIGSVEWLRWKLYNFWGFRDSCCHHYLSFTDSVVTLGFRVNLQYTLFIFSDDSDDSYSSIVVNRGHQWLQCVSQRSGLPFWLLSSTLFLSIFFLIWLCCATATTTPREKGKVQSAVLCAVLSFKRKN